MVGWEAPLMAVADGTMDCDSVVVCAARWSHTASGDGMVYASGFYHGGLPVVVGWVAPLVVFANSTTASEHPHQTFHAIVCFCAQLFFYLFFVCTKHALTV